MKFCIFFLITLFPFFAESQTKIYKGDKLVSEGSFLRFTDGGWLTLECYELKTNKLFLKTHQPKKYSLVVTSEKKVVDYYIKHYPDLAVKFDTISPEKYSIDDAFPIISAKQFRSYKYGMNVFQSTSSLPVELFYDSLLKILGINGISVDAQTRPYVLRTSAIKHGHGSGWIEFKIKPTGDKLLIEARAWGSNNAFINYIIIGQTQLGDLRISTGGHPESPSGYIVRAASSVLLISTGACNFQKEKQTSW